MSGGDVKERILRLIDDSENTWLKAAFYGDPKVSAILERLFEAWESAGRQGMPIDYATREELEDLERAAVKYASMSEAELQMIAYGRIAGSDEGLSLARFIRRLLGLD